MQRLNGKDQHLYIQGTLEGGGTWAELLAGKLPHITPGGG